MLYLDAETWHPTGDIKGLGAYKYMQDAEILLIAWARDRAPVQVWDATVEPLPPLELVHLIQDQNELLCSHGTFDRLMVRDLLKLETRIERWRDTMAKAYSLSLPPSLDQLCTVLKISTDKAKLKDGKALVRKFCQPAPASHSVRQYNRANSPEDWARFIEYCRLDVEAMRACDEIMPDTNYHGEELALWHLDQLINDRGVPINRRNARRCQDLSFDLTRQMETRLREILNSGTATVNSLAALKEYLAACGIEVENLQAATIDEMLEGDLPAEARELLQIRRSGGKSSTKKFETLVRATGDDGRLRGTLQWCGASRTGRWAGRLFQPQNLPRQFLDTDTLYDAVDANMIDLVYGEEAMDALSQAIRGTIEAPDGKLLVWADLSGIEARVLPWLALDDATLSVFREGRDIYKETAARIYKSEPDRITDDERFVGKVATLSLGYQGAVNAFQKMARNYGVKIDEEFALKVVKQWRARNEPITTFWDDLEGAVRHVLRNRGQRIGVRRLDIRATSRCLQIRLPSGRLLHYWHPSIGTVKFTDKDTGEEIVRENAIKYKGTHQQSGRWVQQSTYGGKLTENVTQAVARDILAQAMPAIERRGYRIITTIHDEIVTEVPWAAEYGYRWQEVADIMTRNPVWAAGLPLKADGKQSTRYRK